MTKRTKRTHWNGVKLHTTHASEFLTPVRELNRAQTLRLQKCLGKDDVDGTYITLQQNTVISNMGDSPKEFENNNKNAWFPYVHSGYRLVKEPSELTLKCYKYIPKGEYILIDGKYISSEIVWVERPEDEVDPMSTYSDDGSVI